MQLESGGIPRQVVLNRLRHDLWGWATAMHPIHAVKVFTATRAADREALGARLTAWVQAHPEYEVLQTTVTQSSDASFHCLTIVLFLRLRPGP